MEQTLKNCEVCSVSEVKLDCCCPKCRLINKVLSLYHESNIPLRYWRLEMGADFRGDAILSEKYQEIIKDLKQVYSKGICICFAGSNGVGKTLTCTNILKRAAEKGFSALYTTLGDIVSNVVSPESDDKSIARRELLMVDFLVIDEFDPRYMGSGQAADLFGRTLEDIFRARVQNNLPTFMCTNSPNVTESFTGSIKQSISSLMNYVDIIPVLGKDFRKERV